MEQHGPEDVEGHFVGTVGRGADLSREGYERLALEMLAVEAGDVIEVKDAMRKIIASAPEGADIAFLLSRALAHAGDRALTSGASLPLSWELESLQRDPDSWQMSWRQSDGPRMWWVAAAVPLLVAVAMFGWMGELALQNPEDGRDPVGLAAISMFVITVGSLGAALVGIETLFLLRGQAESRLALSTSPACPPGWYVDPWGQGTSRWWDGSHWTGRLRV
jgi:Protein of unknown function (DUF2510)